MHLLVCNIQSSKILNTSDILLFLLGNINKYLTFSFARSNESHCGYSNLINDVLLISLITSRLFK